MEKMCSRLKMTQNDGSFPTFISVALSFVSDFGKENFFLQWLGGQGLVESLSKNHFYIVAFF